MRKTLLLACLAVLSLSASAQTLSKRQVVRIANAEKLSQNMKAFSPSQLVKSSSKAMAKVASSNDVNGIYITTDYDQDNDFYETYNDTIADATITENGQTFKVKKATLCGDFYVYGDYDATSKTLTVPSYQYASDEKQVYLTNSENKTDTTKIIFVAFKPSEQAGYVSFATDLVLKYDENTKNFALADSLSGFGYVIESGEYQGQLYVGAFNAKGLYRANGKQTGARNARGTWTQFEAPVYIDDSQFEDGVMDIYGGIPGTRIEVNVNEGDSTGYVDAGSKMYHLSGLNDSEKETYGSYMGIYAIKASDRQGYITTDYAKTEIPVKISSNRVVTFSDDNDAEYGLYYIICTKADSEGQRYSYGYFHGVTFTPESTTTGINGIKTTTEKKADGRIYNLAGQQVDKNFKGIVIENGVKRIQK